MSTSAAATAVCRIPRRKFAECLNLTITPVSYNPQECAASASASVSVSSSPRSTGTRGSCGGSRGATDFARQTASLTPEPRTPLVPISAPHGDRLRFGEPLPQCPDRGSGGEVTVDEGPTLITPMIFLGSYADVRNAAALRRAGIRRVLNVAADCAAPEGSGSAYAAPAGCAVRHVLMRDRSDEDIAARLPECLAFIAEAVERREPVLVHCRKGVSRSATVVIAYLMTTEGIGCDAALARVQALRPCVSPNFGFLNALAELEARMLRSGV